VKSSDVRVLNCPKCGNTGCGKMVSMPAKTGALWGDTTFGINGKFNAGLGTSIISRAHEDSILKQRGLVRETDLPRDFYESHTTKLREEKVKLDKDANTYLANVKKFGGDKAKAVVETFPAHQMLAEAHAADTSSPIEITGDNK